MRKRWTLIPAEEHTVAHLEEVLKIHLVFCKLLVQRGITNYHQAKTFFRPDLSQLHDPFLMADMDKAVERLERAIATEEKILLYGDYDVDGTTCVALMYTFLSLHHNRLDYYIPDRYKEGYGISKEGIEYANETGATLILAMDCGITAHEQVDHASSLGIDFIICDHHLPDGQIPKAMAVLDPMRDDCDYPFKGLSGCGVAFKLAQAYTTKNDLREHDLFSLLDILVLSIAADIVPMTGENRTLAHFGLMQLNKTNRIGLQALIEQSRRALYLSISDIVFGLAPMINAAGRMGDAKQAVRLLLSKDEQVAADTARFLQHQNELRKEHDQHILREAKQQFLELPDFESRKSILLYNESWHKGVVGIAAARMVEAFHRPTILLTKSNGLATGSARSVPGFNIYQAVKSCEDLLTNFGGHDHAAGVSLPVECVSKFQERFEKEVESTISEAQQIPELKIAAVLRLDDINERFWNILHQFAPFGPGNRSPIFVSKNVVDTGHSKLLKGNHLKITVKQENSQPVSGIAFGMGEHFSTIKSKKPFHVAYKVEKEAWKGKNYLRIVVRDFWFP